MDSAWLVYDWANAVSTNNTPDEECNASDGHNDGFHREQMPTMFVHLSCSNLLSTAASTYILWIGNQMAGSEISQKRKKHMKSFVSVPDDAGRWFAGD